MPALAAIAGGAARPSGETAVATLARLLLLSAGITRKVTYANGRETYFRAAACTGALYHVDLYVVCGTLPGLAAGVYHFGPHDFSLRRLRAGDYRGVLARAAAGEPAVAGAAVVLVSVSTVWRNAWKYRARAYRHCFWDDGTMLANALAAAAAVEMLDARRRRVHRRVGRTVARHRRPSRGGALPARARHASGCSGGAGAGAARRSRSRPNAGARARSTTPRSRRCTRRRRSTPRRRSAAWRAAAASVASQPERPLDTGARIPLRPTAALPAEPIDSVIRRRGSSRAFARTAIGFEELSTMVVHATQGLDADFLPSPSAHLSDLVPDRARRRRPRARNLRPSPRGPDAGAPPRRRLPPGSRRSSTSGRISRATRA